MNTNERQLLCAPAVTVGMAGEARVGTVAEGSECRLSSEEIKDRFFQGKNTAVCMCACMSFSSLLFSLSKACLCHEHYLLREGVMINSPLLMLRILIQERPQGVQGPARGLEYTPKQAKSRL